MLMINYILGLTGTLNVTLWRNSILGLDFFQMFLGVVMYNDEFGTKKNKIQTTTFTYPFHWFMVNTEIWMINLFWLLFKSNPWRYFVSQTIKKCSNRSVKLVLIFFSLDTLLHFSINMFSKEFCQCCSSQLTDDVALYDVETN